MIDTWFDTGDRKNYDIRFPESWDFPEPIAPILWTLEAACSRPYRRPAGVGISPLLTIRLRRKP
jgi:hypothetical protein